ncbi:MAG: hypothetical protein HY556_03900 [Euryarchaeota archaeon]|nr:hypothetical protein [Euryarchaeota archaeon]
MRGSTQLLVGLSVVVAGVGAVVLGLANEEATVRYVADIVQSPDSHYRGTYTLLGTGEPPRIPDASASGLSTNPAFRNAVNLTRVWYDQGKPRQSTLTTWAEEMPDGSTRWTFENATSAPGNTSWSQPPSRSSWTVSGTHSYFLIRAFRTGESEPATIWGLYMGNLPEPMQPKPGQFKGHLLSVAPDGTPIPEGALVYLVEQYTAGCSSRFVPSEETQGGV